MKVRLAPVRIFLAVGLLGLAGLAAAVLLATRQPWLGVDLAPDMARGVVLVTDARGPAAAIPEGAVLRAVAETDGPPIAITPTTIIEEPDQLSDFHALDAFRAEQDALARSLRSGTVRLELTTPQGEPREVVVRPAPDRPVSDLPVAFWMQVLVGLCGVLVGAWIWSLAPLRLAQCFVMLTGIGLALSSTAAAIYSTRELALPLEYFRWLGPLNLTGSMTFGAGTIGLFLVYPNRLGPRWLIPLQIAIIAMWVAASATRVIPDYVAAYQLPIATAMLVLTFLVILQFRRARVSKDLPAHAALRLFGLSILIGAGSFVALVTVPQLLGLEAQLSQGYAFGLFLICYLGLALAVRRHRIFNLEIWSFRILFFALGALLLVALDAALIYGLALDRAPALGLSLFAVAFLYLPVRDWLARRLARRRGQKPIERHVAALSAVALTKDPAHRVKQWDTLLQDMFQPLAIEDVARDRSNAELEKEGVDLIVPSIPPLPARRLKWGGGGRRLYSELDRQRAAEVAALLAQLIEGQEAYETGAAEERARIARDIHDNIGVQLLGALHSGDPGRKDVLIRETLADLREFIDNKSGPGLDLGNLIADLRLELTEVLEAAGLSVDWPLGADLSGHAVSPRVAHALRSVVREAITNAIRHADARRVSVSFDVADGAVHAEVQDDGHGLDPHTTMDSGQGIANMQMRVSVLGGRIDVVGCGERDGTRITLSLPLIREQGNVTNRVEAAQ
jgi:signal transduction histidine kinase